jgi:HAD superfamily hydrolase (TIGR01450 family)
MRRYDHVLLDLDGCVWVGDAATPGAVEAVEALRGAGRRVAFVTNNAMHSGEDFVRRLWGLGFKASLEEVVTVGSALQHVLHERSGWRRAFVIGAEALHRHVEDSGVRVMNGSDLAGARGRGGRRRAPAHFDYDELRTATLAVARAARTSWARTATRRTPPRTARGPGSGAILAALETGDRSAQAEIVGKPSPAAVPHGAGPPRAGPGAGGRGPAGRGRRRGAAPRAWTARSCSPGPARPPKAAAWEPAPTLVAASLADVVLGAGAGYEPVSDAPHRPPGQPRRGRWAGRGRARAGAGSACPSWASTERTVMTSSLRGRARRRPGRPSAAARSPWS